ncbi:hypothetical protein MKY04_12580 [Lysinibacillus telephonicus]|uniref:hypothetical protein n=1 Tax=Lysinibacillus telephonicus TaxID=1714840 RepID=UPI0031FC3269
MKKYILPLPLLFILLLFGCGNEQTKVNEEDVIIDAEQFSNITSSELISILGEPQSVEPYEWKVPSTNQSIVGDLYTYEEGKYEFILFDDNVVRLSINSGSYWGYDESTFGFIDNESILQLFGISDTYDDMRKTEDNGLMQRYERVSEGVSRVEIYEIQNDTFGFARITYNESYY